MTSTPPLTPSGKPSSPPPPMSNLPPPSTAPAPPMGAAKAASPTGLPPPPAGLPPAPKAGRPSLGGLAASRSPRSAGLLGGGGDAGAGAPIGSAASPLAPGEKTPPMPPAGGLASPTNDANEKPAAAKEAAAAADAAEKQASPKGDIEEAKGGEVPVEDAASPEKADDKTVAAPEGSGEGAESPLNLLFKEFVPSLPDPVCQGLMVAGCATMVFAFFAILLLGQHMATISATVQRECVVASSRIESMPAKLRKNDHSNRLRPIVEVQVEGMGPVVEATRYGPNSNWGVPSRHDAQEYLQNFPDGYSVLCYEFPDGAIKLDETVEAGASLPIAIIMFLFTGLLCSGTVLLFWMKVTGRDGKIHPEKELDKESSAYEAQGPQAAYAPQAFPGGGPAYPTAMPAAPNQLMLMAPPGMPGGSPAPYPGFAGSMPGTMPPAMAPFGMAPRPMAGTMPGMMPPAAMPGMMGGGFPPGMAGAFPGARPQLALPPPGGFPGFMPMAAPPSALPPMLPSPGPLGPSGGAAAMAPGLMAMPQPMPFGGGPGMPMPQMPMPQMPMLGGSTMMAAAKAGPWAAPAQPQLPLVS
eukprot:TRINITY_DN19977_c0_g1_i3.p1 TRINITY_DN19977_c0_g1~~TRINITY_DN19977_c0_g1_i3.p1  ORF type:complete len:581 (+),score=126.90 TRINITY_DN19977_c0_g1_i3:88-1830(+)